MHISPDHWLLPEFRPHWAAFSSAITLIATVLAGLKFTRKYRASPQASSDAGMSQDATG